MQSKLAILGGERTINIKSPHFKWPPITQETVDAVVKQLHESISIYDKSGIIDEVERMLASYYGRKHALLTNSGTMAIYSMYMASDLKEGDEVIVPTYNFFASAAPLFYTGAVPILCDSEPNTGNIDPKDVKKRITKRTKGISITHMWGVPCDMDEITELAKQYELLLFEDFSHAHGAEFKKKKIGSFGNVAAASFQAQKVLTGGEGGILLTDNDEIYYRAVLLGHYNKRALQEIPKEHPLYRFAVTGMGLKLRIHPLSAAMIKQQFSHLEEWLKQKREFAQYITEHLQELPGIQPPQIPHSKLPSWYAYLLQYKPEELGGLPIDKFYSALKAEGCIEVDRPGSTCPLNYLPLFQDPSMIFPNYMGKVKHSRGEFPVAEKFHEHSIKLPVWYDPNDKEIVDLYIQSFRKVIENYREIL